MEYMSAIGGMCMGELANMYNVMEIRMLMEVDTTHRMVEVRDVEMEEVHDQLWDFDMRVAEVEECIGAAERTHDAFEAFVDGFNLRVHRLEREVQELQQQVGELLMFQAVLQHGPGNPVMVEDEEEEDKDLEVPDFPAWVPGGVVGQLVPIEDGEEDEVDIDVAAQAIVDEGGAAPEYAPGADLPDYEEAPEYQIPPVIE